MASAKKDTETKLTEAEAAELKKLEEEEAAAKLAADAAALAATTANTPSAETPFEYPPDAPNASEPVVPSLAEWKQAGYPEQGYYRRFGKNPTPNTHLLRQAPSEQSQNQKPRVVGDIPVQCLKTETHVELGGRRYQFLQGQEITMNPDHAEEMEQAGWVKRIDVVE